MSSNELIINTTEKGSRIALLEDKKLVEYHQDNASDQFQVGDIYLGRVRKVVAGLNAAFVNIGYYKDAFLHYTDLGPHFSSIKNFTKQTRQHKKVLPLSQVKLKQLLDKNGNISDVISGNDLILVQIEKVPILKKGPRASASLSLAGRYLVVIPFADGINISKRISTEQEKNRLLKLVQSIKPNHFGIVVRTAAEGIEAAKLIQDLGKLIHIWQEGVGRLPIVKEHQRIMSSVSKVRLLLRDLLDDSFDSIYTDNKDDYEDILSYLKEMDSEKVKILKFYQSRKKIFEHFGIERQLKVLFMRKVFLPSGGSLIIEPTEALHVIDVNSGKSTGQSDQETNALSTNLEACPEIARQIRLRDLGGIIVIDFIDMKQKEHKEKLYKSMKEAMATDRSKYTLLPLTRFGLMQITRHRVRPSVKIETTETCLACHGTGKISSSLGMGEMIAQRIDYLFHEKQVKKLRVILHPYIYAYFKYKGWNSKATKWFWKYGKALRLTEDSSLGIQQYHLINEEGKNLNEQYDENPEVEKTD